MDNYSEWFIEAIATNNREDLEMIAQALGVQVYYRRGKVKVFKVIRDIAKALNKQ